MHLFQTTFTHRFSRRPYFSFEEILRDELERVAGVSSSEGFSPAIFFTSTDPGNEGQVKFNEFIEGRIGWRVVELPPSQSDVCNPAMSDERFRLIRFDALISYTLGGLLASNKHIKHVMVVSDSWPLHAPVNDCIDRGVPVTMAFFGQVVDPRWHNLFRSEREHLNFLDLDDCQDTLFQRSGPPRQTPKSKISGLF